MKTEIFLTFDHELPLGKLNVSYAEAMFEPTNKVLEIAEKHNVKVTLFTDILSNFMMKKWGENKYFEAYQAQLQDAIRRGHDVQLHLHPHWLTSKFDKGVILTSEDFTLSDFSTNQEWGGIEGIIKLGIQELNDIIKPIKPDYKCVAYRAGGYNIAPKTATIFKGLYENGIRYDSSMAKNYYFKSKNSEVNFFNLPKQMNWKINPEDYKTVSQQENSILEIPIATISKSFFEVPTRFKLQRYAHRSVKNRGTMIHDGYKLSFKEKINSYRSARMLSFDNYTLSLDYLLKIVDDTIQKQNGKTEKLRFALVSHPKSMGNYAFELMDKFIPLVQKKYATLSFTTYDELHRR